MAHYVIVEPSFKLTDTNKFGGFLINSLRHKKHLKKSDLKFSAGEVHLMVSISDHYEKNYGIFISKSGQYRFVKFLFDDFNDRMVDYVHERLTGKKGDIKKALMNFRNKFYITEDELPYYSMKKQYDRAVFEITSCKSA